MPSTPLLLFLLLILTFPIPPTASVERGHFSPSALGFPIALSFIPRSAFTTKTPRSWEVARCVQALVTVWVGMGALRGMRRTWARIRGQTLKLDSDTKTGDKKQDAQTAPRSTFLQSPLLTALPLHLLSWRLATTLILPDLPEAWDWPLDATTLIGTGAGLICSWAEVWGLMSFFGFGGERQRVKGGKVTRMITLALSLYRLYCSVRILGATFDTTGGGGKGIPPLPSHVPA